MPIPFPSPTKTWHSTSYPSISPTRPELSVKGKSILITGGGTGIGAAIAHSFASAGASRIALLGRRPEPLATTKASIETQFPSTKVPTYSVDVTNPDEVTSAFESFAPKDTPQKIDILISCAGFLGPKTPFLSTPPADFMTGVTTNLAMAYNTACAFIPRATADATVVDVNSMVAHVHIGDAFGAYTVGKWADVRLWALVQANNPGFNVYSIQPGLLDTDMSRQGGGMAAMDYEDDMSLPADFSVWLASPEARFLKGKFLWSSWDVEELKAQAEEIKATHKYSVGMVGYPFGEGDGVVQGTWN